MADLLTIDGFGYNIRTLQVIDFFVLPAVVRPNVVVREPGQALALPFSTNTLYSQTQLILETVKPIIPLYYATSCFSAAGNVITPQYAFSTPFLCEVKQNGAPAFLNGVPRYRKYASKIAPYAQRVTYALKAPGVNQKQFIGDINLLNFEMIGFNSKDFLTGGYPAYLMPTDGQKWYLNYLESTSVPATPTYDSTAVISQVVTPGGFNIETLFMYAELE